MLALTATALILSMTTWFSATAILPELRAVYRLSEGGASWLTNAVQLGFVVAALGLGISGLADVMPPRVLMAGAALLAAVSNLALLVAPDATALFAARFITGMALAGIYPPALKLIASWFVTGRGVALGAALGALTLGSSAPYLVRAVGAALDWHLVVATSSACALISALLLAVFVAEGPHAAARPALDLRRVTTVLRDPALSLANLGYFGHMWELYAMWGWFLAFAGATTQKLPVSPAMLTFLVIATGFLGCMAGGLLSDRIGRTATTATMMAISGACALGIGVVFDGPGWLFLAIALLWGFAIIADSAQFSAMVTELGDPQSIGAALALQVAIGFALTIVSIRLTPLLASHIGWRWSLVMLAPGPFIGVAAMLTLRAHPRARAMANGRR
jgi:predicted MFS family arabinose efflux permease